MHPAVRITLDISALFRKQSVADKVLEMPRVTSKVVRERHALMTQIRAIYGFVEPAVRNHPVVYAGAGDIPAD